MTDLLPIAIGLGLVVSLLLSEYLGVASAGMVVPGYVALYLTMPARLLVTAVAAGLTYGAIRIIGEYLIVYGRRRTALAILLGYLLGAVAGRVGEHSFASADAGDETVIGYIIPGLVAIWMDRQGPVETLSALTICSVLVRLLLVLFVGAELPP
ncbi:MAG: poly-gamma-glutamate biosynthesis protein PgsC [Myxococcales bacterium]|jgi:poly-gamma-glutamate biosynthesis protein PgsC/CapC|nr:poly-gamma-glutamate biosynthesis protein PgsC [Myxococcales bacterium]